MIFNTVFVIWGIQLLSNFIFFHQHKNLRFKAGCLIWVTMVFLHLFNAAFVSRILATYLSNEDEITTGQWAQSPGLDNPFVLFFAGLIGTIILQVIFNLGKGSKHSDEMPDTYGTREGEDNLKSRS
jgi:hypothetical protein